MNNSYLKDWLEEAETIPDQVTNQFNGITLETLNRKPHPGQWSIGELFDHLTVTNGLYLPLFQRVIEGQHKNPFTAKFGYLTGFFGKAILNSVKPENKKKLKTVGRFKPNSSEFDLSKIDEFLTQHKELIELIKRTDEVDHQRTFIRSPANPIIVYSLEHANKIILAHEFRHIHQAATLLNVE